MCERQWFGSLMIYQTLYYNSVGIIYATLGSGLLNYCRPFCKMILITAHCISERNKLTICTIVLYINCLSFLSMTCFSSEASTDL